MLIEKEKVLEEIEQAKSGYVLPGADSYDNGFVKACKIISDNISALPAAEEVEKENARLKANRFDPATQLVVDREKVEELMARICNSIDSVGGYHRVQIEEMFTAAGLGRETERNEHAKD